MIYVHVYVNGCTDVRMYVCPLNVTVIIPRTTILGILNMKTAQIVLKMGIRNEQKESSENRALAQVCLVMLA